MACDESAVATALLYLANNPAEGRLTVRSLDRQGDRVRYAESLPPEVVVARPATQTGAQADTKTKRQSTTAVTRQCDRDRLIPGTAAMNVTDDRLRDIETELKRFSLQQYPNAVSVLFRVFLGSAGKRLR